MAKNISYSSVIFVLGCEYLGSDSRLGTYDLQSAKMRSSALSRYASPSCFWRSMVSGTIFIRISSSVLISLGGGKYACSKAQAAQRKSYLARLLSSFWTLIQATIGIVILRCGDFEPRERNGNDGNVIGLRSIKVYLGEWADIQQLQRAENELWRLFWWSLSDQNAKSRAWVQVYKETRCWVQMTSNNPDQLIIRTSELHGCKI